MRIVAIEHVQLAMPEGGEAQARRFYTGVLGITETPKPPHLAARGGCWFEQGGLKVHLGVEKAFQPARKAHPAFVVEDLPALKAKLAAAGFTPREDEPLEGYDTCYVDDPFGNRLELMEVNSSS
jgi:catechol 2,3-dioxygenase-like lactoylglutathione lyase family enzyme